MEKMIHLLNTTINKALLILLCIFLLGISCSKENSDVTPPPPPPPPPPADTTKNVSLFTATDGPIGIFTQNDSFGAIELGVKFQTSIAGKIAGVKFYKARGNNGTHTGQLYTKDGTLLASQEFTNESDSGWQSVMFTNPVPIAANMTYIAAYHSNLGNYSSSHAGLKTAIINAPLTALADSTEGYNGLFRYTATPAIPDTSFASNNYWVDLIETIHK